MNTLLADCRVAILVADGFEQREMTCPRQALDAVGARTALVALRSGEVEAWLHDHFGQTFSVDLTVDEAAERDFDALLLPGGVLNPDALRASGSAARFVRDFVHAGKPVAAIGHGLQTMIEADVVRDRTVTSFPSVKADLIKAGAKWVDAAVVVDRGLVTSRSPADLELFNAMMIDQFAHGRWPDRPGVRSHSKPDVP